MGATVLIKKRGCLAPMAPTLKRPLLFEYCKDLWIWSFGYESLLNSTWHNKEFHNFHHAIVYWGIGNTTRHVMSGIYKIYIFIFLCKWEIHTLPNCLFLCCICVWRYDKLVLPILLHPWNLLLEILYARKHLPRGYILGVLKHTTAWDRHWWGDETLGAIQ